MFFKTQCLLLSVVIRFGYECDFNDVPFMITHTHSH